MVRIGIALLCAALLSGCTEGIDSPASCALDQLATLPILSDSHLVVVGKLNRSEANFVLDTGAEGEQITPEAAISHGLAHSRGQARIAGLGGTMTVPLVFANIELGGLEVQRVVAEAPLPASRMLSYAGLIGADMLSDYDLEVSLPEGRVRLWRARHCAGDYVRWPGPHRTVPLQKTAGGRLFIPATIDGVRLTAILDTGASATLLSVDAARQRGLDLHDLDSDPAIRMRGIDGNALETHRHRFNTLSIGSDTFRNPTIAVGAPPFKQGDMLLGLDWFRHRRVWISWDSRQVFVQDAAEIPPS